MVILALARMFHDADTAQHSQRALIARMSVLALPIALIAIQPDLGTAILITLIVLTVGFLSMPSVWPMVYVTLGGLLAVPALWETMHDYQKNRILAFIDPSVDRRGTAGTRDSRSSRSAAGSCSARASARARRTSSTSCPSTGPTSRSPSGPRSGASSARCS